MLPTILSSFARIPFKIHHNIYRAANSGGNHSGARGGERGFPMNSESDSMQREDSMGIEIRGMAPLFQVFDMATSIAFYRDVLGFEVVATSPPRGGHFDWALLRLSGVELMLNTAYEEDARPGAPDAGRVAAHEDTCLYFGCPDVDAAYTCLQARGVAAEQPKVAPYGMKQLYLRDPDGYSLCFQWAVK
jgi:glyoxylase I family protein